MGMTRTEKRRWPISPSAMQAVQSEIAEAQPKPEAIVVLPPSPGAIRFNIRQVADRFNPARRWSNMIAGFISAAVSRQ